MRVDVAGKCLLASRVGAPCPLVGVCWAGHHRRRSSFTTRHAERLVQRAPEAAQPYLRLGRFDKPVGTWLLLWPGLSGLALMAAGGDPVAGGSTAVLLAKFTAGAVLMRSVGCCINDLWDRDIDRKVERTRTRPLASGQLGVGRALAFTGAQAGCALGLLLSLNEETVVLGLLAVPLVAVYPLMKRVTHLPQLVLGLNMSYGVLMASTATVGHVTAPALALYTSLAAWTVFYDTVYALQDRRDDLAIGVKSTAIAFGQHVQRPLAALAATTTAGLLLTGAAAGLAWPYFLGVGGMGAALAHQVATLRPHCPSDCMAKFLQHPTLGLLLFLSIAAGKVL